MNETLIDKKKINLAKSIEDLQKKILESPPEMDYEEFAQEISSLKEEFKNMDTLCEAFASKTYESVIKNFPVIEKILRSLKIFEMMTEEEFESCKLALRRVVISYVLSNMCGFGLFADKETSSATIKAIFTKLYGYLYKKFNDENLMFCIDFTKDAVELVNIKGMDSFFLRLLNQNEEDFEQTLENFSKCLILLSLRSEVQAKLNPEKDVYPKSELLMDIFKIVLPKHVFGFSDAYEAGLKRLLKHEHGYTRCPCIKNEALH